MQVVSQAVSSVSGVGRKLSTFGHVMGTVNLATFSTRLKAVGLNERLLSGLLTPQISELTHN